jgi:predicted amidophosphoribosyltransferase
VENKPIIVTWLCPKCGADLVREYYCEECKQEFTHSQVMQGVDPEILAKRGGKQHGR